MKLTRLRVAELRQFRAPFELAELQPGLNIFSGANEAGKSTLVRAIRAAFFERHRSTSVDDLRPYGDMAAAPTVEIDFEIGDLSCRLSKRFLHKKRCELMLGSRRLEGVEAEDALAERLGFQFALKGASREEHWGIPGLLWIEQGSAQILHDPVLHAADHLRKALDQSLGEVAASGGDEVVNQVRRLREELLTGTGKPRADYARALDDAQAQAGRVAELEQAVAGYRDQVDQLALLRETHARDAQAQPWQALRAQQAQAQQALQAAQALSEQRRQALEQLDQATGLRALLTQRLLAAEQQVQDLARRESTLNAALARREQAAAAETRAVQAHATAATALRAAREALALARQEDNRSLLARQARDAQVRATELTARLSAARSEDRRAAALRSEAAPLRLEPADLAALRDRHRRLNELGIRQEAVATRLRFALDADVTLDLAGEPIAGQAERLLVAPATLQLPGVGRIHIAPGGQDLADLVQARARLQDEQSALLQRLGLATAPDAEARDQAHARHLADAQAADKARKLLAPRGLEALTAELEQAQARAAEAASTLARLPATPGAGTLALDVAESAHAAADVAAEQAARQLQTARQALAGAGSELDAAQREHRALKAVLDDPQRQADLAARQREQVEAGAREATLRADISTIEARIAQARPDILKQDVERFRRSAEQVEQQQQSRALQIAQLEASLAATGAQGLEEELAQAQSDSHRAQRRAAELRGRAEALDFLLGRLELRRQALIRRLQVPLQRHLDHYLQLLFPEGRLAVDENLLPGALTRASARGPQVGEFETLSFGAREQMGVISRLAYADLLKAAGRPTLIILDDALVHSDEPRLARMKRVLFDAAQRHQVLLFTCHPDRWRDMGVALRALEPPAAA